MADELLHVALENYEAPRAQVLEPLKMRDRLIVGYLAAATALFGYGVEQREFEPSLPVLLAFLAL
jgi:hypothetical protein